MSPQISVTTLVVFSLVIGACGGSSSLATAPLSESSTSTETSNVEETVKSEGSKTETEAIADLSSRLRVDSDAIEIVKSEFVTWPDGSLGCPEPGMFYTQALVGGWQVILQHEDRVYPYHAGSDGVPFLCESD